MHSSGTNTAAPALLPAFLYRVVPFVPSHETYGRAGPVAFGLLNEIAEYAAGIGSVYHSVPGGCKASHSLSATAGAHGWQGSISRTACAV